MEKDILLTFHNNGLRSYIEVDLCAQCPRQDDKGCCGYYSPVFYCTDFAYLLEHEPDLIEYIFSLEDITILDASVTINNSIDGDSYRCHFHRKEGGCTLAQNIRESICRHFVCPGINWEAEKSLKPWKDFFDQLSDYEIQLNNNIAAIMKTKGLSLRDKEKRPDFFRELLVIFSRETQNLPDFITKLPPVEQFSIKREITFGTDWPL